MELKLLQKVKEKVKKKVSTAVENHEEKKEKKEDEKEKEPKNMEELQSEEYHKKLMSDIKKYSEEIEDKYDEKLQNLKQEEEEPPDTSKLEERYDDLKKEISEARKNGNYMFTAHNLLLQFPTAVHIAKVTGAIEDIQKAERILKDAEKEYEEWKAKVDEDFSKKLKWKKKEDENEDLGNVDFNRQPASPIQFFYLTNGHVFKTINDLKTHLDHMPDEIFEYHVNDKKNDFANWIKKVFRAKDLASSISTVESKEEMKKILEEEAAKTAKKEKEEASE